MIGLLSRPSRNTKDISCKYIMGDTCGASPIGWLAPKLPVGVSPDHLTLTGFVGALICGLAYGGSWLSPSLLWLASAGLIINWFGDSLDGTLARFRNIERPRYGFFIDNTTDLLSQMCIFFGFGASPYMRFDVACLGLAGYYMVSFFNLIKAMDTRVIKIGFFGVGPTEIRLGFICYNFLLLMVGPWSLNTPFGPMSPIDAVVIITLVVVLISLILTVWSEGRRLAKEEMSLRAE
jgi:archaetidylinositol phosphate synthase